MRALNEDNSFATQCQDVQWPTLLMLAVDTSGRLSKFVLSYSVTLLLIAVLVEIHPAAGMIHPFPHRARLPLSAERARLKTISLLLTKAFILITAWAVKASPQNTYGSLPAVLRTTWKALVGLDPLPSWCLFDLVILHLSFYVLFTRIR